MIANLRRIALILSKREKLLLLVLLATSLLMAVVEIGGIAAISGFLLLVTDPNGAAASPVLGWLARLLGPAHGGDLVVAAGLVLVGVIVLRNLASLAHTWMRLSIIHGMRGTVAGRLLAAYLAHPYPFFLRTNSAEIIKNVTLELDQFVANYLQGYITIFADVISAAAIFAIMFWASPAASGAVFVLLGTVGALLWVTMRGRIGRLGRAARAYSDERIRVVSEASGSVRDVKLLGRESFFVGRLARVHEAIRRNTVRFNVVSEAPRNALEVASIAAILLIFIIALGENGSVAATASVVSMIVVSLYRLMPMAHRILSGAYTLRFNAAICDAIARAMIDGAAYAASRNSDPRPVSFEHEMKIDKLGFAYEGGAGPALSELGLAIKHNDVVGLVGPSGAGKTTLVELMLGLLTPSSGRVLVDGRVIDAGSVAGWQRHCAYVPQTIYLADNTILNNIAFAVPSESVDRARVEWAARLAHLDSFVATLPEGYDTMTGERGVRLSGGQRQRIGIARALYRDAKLLVLDEATSALDGITESVIEDAIAELAGKVTVVIIAHRLTTVRRCNVIHVMDGGRVVASGRYEDLMRDNATFRAMARAAE